ncbi:RNA methyltransferase [Cephaloticoccus primus]|uniref:RNA methyltransferase n=1 Tax=Cephaloticoccus primus TaxID=1548207 RepID=A0A139SKJ3_9BACT|nr:RsmB/NOP family class I SAM-dependent RNA methyltransferase [Cephaloticoccus primus]KXU35078.1 RNA methyltransferase [Cephaloticoccus primus]
MSNVNRLEKGAWASAMRLITRWLEQRERVDSLLAAVPAGLSPIERSRCQYWVYGVVRHFGRIQAALDQLIAHSPRFSTRAVLLLAGYELIEAAATASAAGADDTAAAEAAFTGQTAKIVHHAVEQAKRLASPAEARLVNAVVRKLAPLMARPAPPRLAGPELLATYFSHPEWLVRRWLLQFGAEPTRRLLEWNQESARVFVRWRQNFAANDAAGRTPAGSADSAAPPPEFLRPSGWAGFYEADSGHWAELEPLLKSGAAYVQDPSTRLAVEALELRAGESLLDLCAAPGGKALFAADTTAAPGLAQLVALDLPGARIDRLKENLSTIKGASQVALVQADLLTDARAALREHGLPLAYDAVLLDAPCSNTGVMRRRIDARWRLQERDFRKHAQQQLSLLHAAARFVAPGGRLVYSTCSIDADENEAVVRAFMQSRAGGSAFALEHSAMSYPWESGHDGAGVFRLRKKREP